MKRAVLLTLSGLWLWGAQATQHSVAREVRAYARSDESRVAASEDLWVAGKHDCVTTRGNYVDVDQPIHLVNAVLNKPAFLTADTDRTHDSVVYWELSLDGTAKSSLFVGLVHADVVKGPIPKGYQIRMLGYGAPGNLANGSALLKASWGPPIEEFATVGILAEYTADEGVVRIFFYGDRRPLGLAYEVSADDYPDGLRVAVQLNGPLKITYEPSANAPKKRERDLIPTGVAGVYTLVSPPTRTELTAGSAVASDASRDYTDEELTAMRERVTLTLRAKSQQELYFKLEIVNSFWGVLKKSSKGDGSWNVPQQIPSTRMAGTGPLMQVERLFTNFFARGTRLRVSSINEVSLEDNEGNSAVFQRVPPSQPSVVKDPQFRRD